MKHKLGFKTYVWVKRLSQRNESWDCFVYARAAIALPHSGIKLATMQRDTIMIADKENKAVSRKFGAQKHRMVDLAQDGTPLTTTPKIAAHAAGIVRRSKFGAVNRPIW